MKINLADVNILLKATPQINNFVSLYVEKVTIFSQPYLCEDRLIKSPNTKMKEVWADKMTI